MGLDSIVRSELGSGTNLVGGQWVPAASGEEFEVRNPATGEMLAKVAHSGKADVDAAVKAAARAWPEFKALSHYARADMLRRIAELIHRDEEKIARVMTMEQGKPYATEALPEVQETAYNFQIFAEDVGTWETGSLIPFRDPAKRVYTVHESYGVMAVITPWNFPTLIPAEYIAPALAVGNTIVMKPPSYTPLSMILVAKCIHEALAEFGVPDGVFNLITGPGSTVGDCLVSHPTVAIIGFTGETVTGEAICSRAGIKKTMMELGGNGPQIVCDDADLEAAAKAAALGCFFNAGQVCCATERILVQKQVHDEFLRLLLRETAASWKLGDPFNGVTTMGPLNNEPTAVKVEEHIADAVSKGATVLSGGSREDGYPTNLYFPPTVLDGVSRDSLLNFEETFGPVAPIFTFETDEEALEIAHESNYGLQMSVFSASLKRCHYFADRLRSGSIIINDSSDWWEAHLPFGGGGGTRSGHGRLGMRYAMEDMTHLKTIAWHVL